MTDQDRAGRAFAFEGNWREFAPIAFTNLLLTLVTLGVYIFWARTRERRYLWSRTRFIDERLEWGGTGFELFLGYVMALLFLIAPIVLVQFGAQALAIRNHVGLAGLLIFGIYILVFYLIGVAIFRALRYRLSRTFWRGIRGGSDDPGLAYGLSHLWKTAVGSLALGLLIPWSMVSLWNERWNAMSFGPFRFRSGATSGPLMGRFLLYYLVPVVAAVGMFVVVGSFASAPRTVSPGQGPGDFQAAVALTILAFYLIFFVLLGFVALFYYSAYFREVVGHLELGDLEFEFDATTADWFKLILGNFALVIVTLGIGALFLGYRNWSFFVRHLNAYGALDLDSFTQSTTRAPGQGEGLLDAFDVGAF
ncbi:MAG: YjgN family protein [Pseudomonadota bacterium]